MENINICRFYSKAVTSSSSPWEEDIYPGKFRKQPGQYLRIMLICKRLTGYGLKVRLSDCLTGSKKTEDKFNPVFRIVIDHIATVIDNPEEG